MSSYKRGNPEFALMLSKRVDAVNVARFVSIITEFGRSPEPEPAGETLIERIAKMVDGALDE